MDCPSEDLSIIGFDGTDLADYLGLTTIDQRLDESGRLAAEMLMSRISDRGRPLQNTRLQLKLIPRDTTERGARPAR
jgi:LacI family transcriptional regulator